MLQHRRTIITIFAALSLVYFYTLQSNSPGYRPPSWVRLSRDDDDVLNSTLGFAEIFVINLPSRRDRRDAMAMAAVVSNLTLTFLDGFTGDGVPTSPSVGESSDKETGTKPRPAGARGSWRSHMNAIQMAVAQGLGSALVLEDDVDWDVRLKSQMETFARAARMWLDVDDEAKRRRISRLRNHGPTKSRRRVMGGPGSPLSEEKEQRDLRARSRIGLGPDPAADSRRAIMEESGRDTIPLSPNLLSSNPGRKTHTESPYGDDWDVIWLGHCGADLPTPHQEPGPSPKKKVSSSSSLSSSSSTISIPDDVTVPAPKHLKPHPFALHDKLAEVYPPHTRVVHAVSGNVCSLAYAVSQRGARKLLRRFAQEGFVEQWDLMLRDYCMGEYADGGGERGSDRGEEGEDGGPPVCITVQPPLISHHYAGEEGASVSDIRGQGGGLARGRKGTPYVRLSVQQNLGRLGAGLSVVDQLPDDGDPLW